jgi:hypothetical protein
MRTSGRGVVLVGFIVTLVLALRGASAIVAADEGDPAVIYACVKGNGETRIVKPSETCKQREVALHWDLPGLVRDALASGSQAPAGETTHAGSPGRSAAVEELNDIPCTTPGGAAGMVIEVRSYGKSGVPTLRCRLPGGRFISACTRDQAMGDWLDILNGWCDSCRDKGGFAGYDDWRLPTLAELLTIVDTSRVPAIDLAFGEMEGREYWSASTDDVGPPAAVAVNFFNGGAIEVSKTYPTRVRAVRGGP